MTLKLQKVESAPVKGTLQLHAVNINYDRTLCTRAMSCYIIEYIAGLACDTSTVIDTENSRQKMLKVQGHLTVQATMKRHFMKENGMLDR